MKAKAKADKVTVASLSATVRSKITQRLTDAFQASSEYGLAVVKSFCKDFPEVTAISADDLTMIVMPLAKSRKWSEKTIPVRKSECKALILQAGNLPDAMEAFLKRTHHANWTDAVKLARMLQKHDGDVKAAVRDAANSKDSKPKGPKAKCVAAIKRILNMRGIDSTFKAKLAKLASDSGYKVEA